MADRDTKQPTHTALSVIKREGKQDYWLNIGLVLPHKDARLHHQAAGVPARRQDRLPREGRRRRTGR